MNVVKLPPVFIQLLLVEESCHRCHGVNGRTHLDGDAGDVLVDRPKIPPADFVLDDQLSVWTVRPFADDNPLRDRIDRLINVVAAGPLHVDPRVKMRWDRRPCLPHQSILADAGKHQPPKGMTIGDVERKVYFLTCITGSRGEKKDEKQNGHGDFEM